MKRKEIKNLITGIYNSFDEFGTAFKKGVHYARDNYLQLVRVEARLAEYVGSEDAALFNSGMAGIVTLMETLFYFFCNRKGASDYPFLVAAKTLYGETKKYFESLNLRAVCFLSEETTGEFFYNCSAGQPDIIFIETIGNGCEMPIVDIYRLMEIVKDNKRKILVIDNTFLTPRLFNPIEIAKTKGIANRVVVVESMTKYYQEGNDIITGGVIYGPAEILKMVKERRAMMGTYLQPLCLSQLDINAISEIHKKVMSRHSENALELAQWLQKQSQVEEVKYPLLKSHPQYDLAQKLFPNGCGGLFFFKLKGGKAAAQKFVDNLEYCKIGGSFGHDTTWVAPFDAVKEGDTGIIRAEVGFVRGDLQRTISDFEQTLAKI